MYRCEHFELHELVSPDTLQNNEEDVLWLVFDESLLKAADWLRERYGPCTVNNWKWGGDFSQSGLRTKASKHYSPTSQHSKGCALDMKFKNWTAEDIRTDLAAYELEGGKIPEGIRRIERGVTWLHIDCKETGQEKIYWFNP